MFIYKIPLLVQSLAPSLTWRFEDADRSVALTFDDGPVKGITDWVLKVLAEYRIKATFFCVGQNIDQNPGLIEKILEEGHGIGNHTYNHLNAWGTAHKDYIENIIKCQEILDKYIEGNLFRPPHGKILPGHIKRLSKDFRIIMWEVLSGDYRRNINVDTCLSRSLKAVSAGSIIVLHDSYKAQQNLRKLLRPFVEHLLDQEYQFKLL